MKVFVSGCYDMLHSGHIAFFEEASKLGDLYVGIGSDNTIFELKHRKAINNENERLYIVKSIKYVKDAWINSGNGIMDFKEDVMKLHPDIFFVNSDGFTPEKQKFCEENNIKLIVSNRIPHNGLPTRSTTSIRNNYKIPYRVELCGGWLDQLKLNSLYPGSVITMSIEPTIEFNHRSGMATSSRNTMIDIWNGIIPQGNREKLAKQIFCIENPPGTKNISGSQDQLGILLKGINKLNYDNDYWPKSIENISNVDTIEFLTEHLYLIQLSRREQNYDVYKNSIIDIEIIKKLSESSEEFWKGLKNKDLKMIGNSMKKCFENQIKLFPEMLTNEMKEIIKRYDNDIYGYKISGARRWRIFFNNIR